MFHLVVHVGHQAPVCQQLIQHFRSALSVSSSLSSHITHLPITFQFWPPHCRPSTRCLLNRRRGERRGQFESNGERNIGWLCREPNWGLSALLSEVNRPTTLQCVQMYWTWLEIISYYYSLVYRNQYSNWCRPSAMLPSVVTLKCRLYDKLGTKFLLSERVHDDGALVSKRDGCLYWREIWVT